MSGLFTEPTRKKRAPSKKVILFIVIISITILGIRAYLNHITKDEKKSDTTEVKKANVISDTTDNNNNDYDEKKQVNSSLTDVKKDKDTTQDNFISNQFSTKQSKTAIEYSSPVKSNYKTNQVYHESSNNVRKYDHKLIESSIRKEKKLPPNQIDKSSQTFQNLKQVTSADNNLKYENDSIPYVAKNKPSEKDKTPEKPQKKTQITKAKKENILDINVNIFDKKEEVAKKPRVPKKSVNEKTDKKKKAKNLAINEKQQTEEKPQKKRYINIGIKKSKKVNAEEIRKLITREESKLVNKNID